MEYLLHAVASDAASLFSRPSTSTGSTIYGIGATSGKAIIAVGNFLIDRVESIRIRGRLRTIRKRLQNRRCDVKSCRDLFELQRIGLYLDHFRRSSWILIIESLRIGEIHSLVAVLLKWCDVRLFLRQLVAVKLSGWKRDPVDMSLIPSQYIAPKIDRALDDSLFLIISNLLTTRPAVVHGAINTGVFALLLSGTVLELSGDVKQDVSLSIFFYQAKLHSHHGTLETFKKDLWPKFFPYITTASPEDAKNVVEHLLRRCVSLAESTKNHNSFQVIQYFLFLASQVLVAHSTTLDCLFPPEIHFILDAHSSPPASGILMGGVDDVSSIASHIRKALPHIFGLPPFRARKIPPDLLRYILVEFLCKRTACPNHSETCFCTQGNLYNLALVSRSWNSIAIDVLYAHPVLQMSEDMRLFIRTMDSSPALAKLVRSVELRPPRTDHKLMTLADHPKDIVPFPMSTLRECENLNALSIDTLSWASNSPPQMDTLCDLSLVASRIRVLHLTGLVTETVIPHLPLPSLEVLCLRDCTLSLKRSPQPLRRLHTLRLYQCLIVGDTYPLEPSFFQSAFPNLQTCELLAWNFSELESSLGISSRDRGLYPTSLGENPFKDPLKRIRDSEGPRSMTLGVIGDDVEWHDFKGWRIHPSLESLTLILGSPYEHGDPLSCVVEFLTSNLTMYTLRTLCLIYASGESNDSSENPSNESFTVITRICTTWGIKLQLISDFGDIEGYMSSRLRIWDDTVVRNSA